MARERSKRQKKKHEKHEEGLAKTKDELKRQITSEERRKFDVLGEDVQG